MLEELKGQVAVGDGRGGVEGGCEVANPLRRVLMSGKSQLRRVLMSGKFPRSKNTRPNPHAAAAAAATPMQISCDFAACAHKYS